MAETSTPEPRRPTLGEDVYVPTSLHVTHCADDFAGGLCRTVRIDPETAPGGITFVEVEEDPGTLHNWKYLLEHQDEWRARYGDRRGCPDPDHRPEFNEP